MSIDYPTDLDTLTNPVAGDRVNSATVPHATQHANTNDAIEALEAKVGKDSSGVTTSHDYKLSDVATGDKAASLAGADTLTNKTLTSPVLTTPKVTTSINDANGNEVIKTPATASAVNEVEITNSATGNDPLIAPSGDDTDIGLKLKGKGTGKVKVGDAELELPDVDGTDGQLLKTNGSKVLSWVGATTIPDADESTAGIVEEATDAEVTAGTATGSTGAKLFVTPAKLATRTTTVLSDKVQVATIDVSSAEILALHTTPKTLIAAPGAGKLTIVDEVVFSFTAGTQYANGKSTRINYNSDTTDLFSQITAANLIGNASSSVRKCFPITGAGGGGLVITAGTDKAVELSLASSTAFITGTGTLKVFVKYRTITL